MDLTLDNLKEMGAFTGAPVEKEITWKSGGKENKATVFVRKLSYSAALSDLTSKDAIAGRISTSILNAKGEPVFTVDDVNGEADPERGPMCRDLTMELLRVIGEVNEFAEKKTET